MNPRKYMLGIFSLMILFAVGCKKDFFNDVSFLSTAAQPAKLSAMFNITQDNTGLVTITPNGEGAISYDIYYGDNTTTPVSLTAGKSTQHVYAEGVYNVKLVGHDINGNTVTTTQSLTVSFRAPENLKVNVTINSLIVSVSATAKYETFFKVYYGDSSTFTPVPFTSFLEGQTVTHTYPKAGTYILKVVALSGGVATTQFLDTIFVAKQIDMPVTFDDANVNYASSDFGGAQSSVVKDPVVTTNNVMKVIKTSGAQVWAGTTLGTALGFATKLPITMSTSRISCRVYSPAAGLVVKMKIEDHTDATKSVETDVKTTLVNQWETLVFDFKSQATGTAAVNYTYNYDKASIFFDFGNGGTGSIFYCDDFKMMPPSLNQINLPVTFEDATVDYSVIDFGGNSSSLAVDPASSSNHVMKSIKTAGAQVWAGTTVGTGSGFSAPIPLTATAKKMTVRLYSPAAGLDIKLKVEDHNNGGNSVETDVKTTVANQWETLTFDFSNQASGTAAWNATFTYDKASLFFDFGNNGTGSVFYFDDLKMAPAALAQINLPVTFEDPTVDYTMIDFGGNSSAYAVDPSSSSNHVMKSIKTSGAQTWAGTTVGTALGFAAAIPLTASAKKMSVRLYSPAAGLDIKLKIEDHNNSANSVETDVKTTVANQWETLVFDFGTPASGTAAWNASFTYDKASLFFDFGNSGTGSIFYFDDLKTVSAGLSQINLPVTFEDPTVDYSVSDFGSNSTVPAIDPKVSTNHVMMSTKTAGAQSWAGTTIGTALGFATVIPVSASRTKMTVRVYSPAVGLDIKLKIEDHADGTKSVETDVKTTVANQWETLTFDFANQAAGTAAINYTIKYDKASIFFDFGNAGTGSIFYWDDVIIL
jgi:hypothetical protein